MHCISDIRASSDLEKRLKGLHYEYGKLPSCLRHNKAFWSLDHDTRHVIFYAVSPLSAIRSRKRKYNQLQAFLGTQSLFVHIPKTAGVSITNSLYGGKTGDHRSIADYLLLIRNSQFSGIKKFTIVRHPFERLLSAFRYICSGGNNEYDEITYNVYLSRYKKFRDFVLDLPIRPELIQLLHFRPQVSFLRIPGSKEILVNNIIKFEEINNYYSLLQKLTRSEKNLAQLNVRKNRNEKDIETFDSEIVEIVYKMYREDFVALGYDAVPQHRRLLENKNSA